MPDGTEIDIRIPVTNQMIAAGAGVLQEYAMPRELAERVARRIFVEMSINAPPRSASTDIITPEIATPAIAPSVATVGD